HRQGELQPAVGVGGGLDVRPLEPDAVLDAAVVGGLVVDRSQDAGRGGGPGENVDDTGAAHAHGDERPVAAVDDARVGIAEIARPPGLQAVPDVRHGAV